MMGIMMRIIKSINVVRGWKGVDYRYIRSLYYCPLTFFFFFLFFLVFTSISFILILFPWEPLCLWPGLQELTP